MTAPAGLKLKGGRQTTLSFGEVPHRGSARYDRICNALGLWLASSCRPMSMVEDP